MGEYEKKAAEDKLRYTMEKDALERSFVNSPNQDENSTLITKSKNGFQSVSKPVKTVKKKRSPSAYMLFCASHRSMVVDKNGDKLCLPETTKVLAKMWKEC